MANWTGPVLEAALGQYLAGLKEPAAHEPAPPGVRGWASDAMACARQVSFRMAEVERTEPLTTTARLAMQLGRDLETYVLRAAALLLGPGEKFSPQVYWQANGCSGRADAYDPATEAIIEIKSVPPYVWDECVAGRQGREPTGPKHEHVLQAAISGLGVRTMGHQVTTLIPVYVAKAAPGGSACIASWSFPLDAYWELEAQKEMARLRTIAQGVTDRGELAERAYAGKLIDEPRKMRWPCGYCAWLSACEKLPTGCVALK